MVFFFVVVVCLLVCLFSFMFWFLATRHVGP